MNSITKTIVVDGETIKIPRLSLADLFGISDEIVSTRMREAQQLGEAEKLTRIEIANLKLVIKRAKPAIQEIAGLCETPEVAYMVIKHALTKGQVPKDKHANIIDGMKILDATSL